MYARITTYQVKPDKLAELEAKADSVGGEVKKVAGLLDSYTAWSADGKGVTMGIWESKAACDAGSAQIQAIWASLADLLASPPSVAAYDNVRHMSE